MYAGDVSRLHMALRQLAQTPANQTATRPVGDAVVVRRHAPADHLADGLASGISPVHQPAVHSFVDSVRDVVATVDGARILTYDQRQKLLQQAAGISISPFHANLVIAAVLHESTVKVVNTTNARTPEQPKAGNWGLVATIAMVQVTIIGMALSAWWWVGLS